MAPVVSPYSNSAAIPLPLMAVGMNLLAIPSGATIAPAQAMVEIPITTDDSTIDKKYDKMMHVFKAWTFQMGKVIQPRYKGYQPASVYAIQADDPPPNMPMNFPSLDVHAGSTYNRLGHNFLQYPWQEWWPSIHCTELGHIRKFCPDVHTDSVQGMVQLNEWGRLISEPEGGIGGAMPGYRPGRIVLSIREYTLDVARQGQVGGGVANSAAACCSISAVSEGPWLADSLMLRDCSRAVGNQSLSL